MYIKMALREAKKAKHRHQLGAVLLVGGKPVSIAHNHSHVHAEHAALNRAWRSGTYGSTMVVVRLRRDGSVGMSRPCEMCINRMIGAGVKKVVYSDRDGSIKSFKLPSKSEVNQLNIKLQTMLWNKKD